MFGAVINIYGKHQRYRSFMRIVIKCGQAYGLVCTRSNVRERTPVVYNPGMPFNLTLKRARVSVVCDPRR